MHYPKAHILYPFKLWLYLPFCPRPQNSAPHTNAQVLSRRVWDILMVLPTSPQLKDGFGDLSAVTPAKLHTLLDPHIPQKLMYSLYLVASLCSGKDAKVGSIGKGV